MIRTVIFDIGNVLVKFDWKSYVYGTFDEQTANILADAIWKSGYWVEFDRGVFSDAEIVALMEQAAPGYEKEIHTVLEHSGEFLEKYAYTDEWIEALKKSGYRVLYLSNYGESLMERRPDVLDFLSLMDGGLFSCHAKLIKPDPQIYAMLCQNFALNPKECLFLDDNEENVEAARDFGLHAICFHGYEKSYDSVMKYLEEHRKELKKLL